MSDEKPVATIASSRFRLEYASLRVPMIVEVRGHPIGKWVPFVPQFEIASQPLDAFVDAPNYVLKFDQSVDPRTIATAVQAGTAAVQSTSTFVTHEQHEHQRRISPAPKPSARKR